MSCRSHVVTPNCWSQELPDGPLSAQPWVAPLLKQLEPHFRGNGGLPYQGGGSVLLPNIYAKEPSLYPGLLLPTYDILEIHQNKKPKLGSQEPPKGVCPPQWVKG